MAGNPALRHDRCVDESFQGFRGQARPVQVKIAVAFNFRSLQGANPRFEAEGCDTEGFRDVPDLLGSLCFPLGKKRIAPDLNAESFGPELIRNQNRKIRRDHQRSNVAFAEQEIEDIDEGFYVTDLIGSGANMVTGDYSRGAAGFWIEKGQRTYPVSEVTIAGHMLDIFRNAIPANNLQFRYGTNAPTIRLEGLTIAGV